MIEFESFAVELAHEAARVTLPFFRSGIGHEDKGGAAGFDLGGAHGAVGGR